MKLFSEIKSALEGVFSKVESSVHAAIAFTSDEIKQAELAFIKASEDPTALTFSSFFEAGVAFATAKAKEVVSAATSTEAPDEAEKVATEVKTGDEQATTAVGQATTAVEQADPNTPQAPAA